MRTHQRDAAVELVPAPALHLGQQGRGELTGRPGTVDLEAGAVLQLGVVAAGAARHALVGAGQVGPQRVDEGDALGEQLAPDPGQVVVPHRQGGQRPLLRGGSPPRLARGLEQRVALAQHPVVVGAHPGQPGGAQHQQVVEEAPPVGRVALDQDEVLGREDDRAHQPDDLAGPRQRGAVDPGAVAAPGVQLDLEHRRAPVADHRGAHHRLVGARPHQRCVGGHPVRGEPREVVDGLDQVGLALAVAADERRGTRLQRHLGRGVGAEVVQGQVRDVHVMPGRVPGRARRRTSPRP